MINKKNKLRGTALLLSMGIVVSSASALVVACSPRQTPDDTFVQSYSIPVTSWNPAYTQDATDWFFLADIYATSLAIDEYGRTYGDVFESGYAGADGDGSIYVGQPKDEAKQDFKVWKYQIRPEAKWTNAKGKEVRAIKASDYDNTAKSILNSNIGAETSLLWTTFINNGTTMQTLLTAFNKYPEENAISGSNATEIANSAYDKAIELINAGNPITFTKSDIGTGEPISATITPDAGGWGLVTDDVTNTVEFHLNKSASFFETVLTYGPFAPTHEKMSGILASAPADVYSGAYLPNSISGTTKTFKKNPNYHLSEKTSIENTKWIYRPKADSSDNRTLFESGMIDGFVVDQDDAAGWKKYVGDDSLNPISTNYYVAEPTEDFSQMMSFNAVHGDIKTQSESSTAFKHALAGSQVLQSSATRAFISSSLERYRAAKFYSLKFDENDTSSMNVRNVFTSPNFVIDASNDNKDYVEYVKETIANNSTPTDDSARDYDEGKDALNQEILSYPVDFDDDGDLDNNVTREQLIEEINSFIEENNIYKTNGKVELDFRLNPGNDQSLNPYLTSMINTFNEIANNPLKINIVRSTTADDYPKDLSKSLFHLGYSAWGPDYADPYSYLATFQTDGDYKEYSGFDEITDFSKINTTLSDASKQALKTSSYEAFTKIITDTTATLTSHDKQTYENSAERYTAFAQDEYEMIYQNHLFVPLYNRNPLYQYKISKIQNYTYGHAIYGISSLKTFTLVKNPELLTTQENKIVSDSYKAYKAKVDADVTLDKKDNVLYN